MTLDKKLRLLRQEKGNTQKELAEFLSIPRQSISKWERGKAVPATDFIEKIAEFYEINFHHLASSRFAICLVMYEKETGDFVGNKKR